MISFVLAVGAVALGLVVLWLLAEFRRKPMGKALRADALGEFTRLPLGVTHFRWVGPPDGPVVLCIHGLTSPSPVWEWLAGGLARRGYRVLTYDLYGRGFSARPLRRNTLALFLRQIDDLLCDQKVDDPINVLGYSMGGAIATGFADANPDRVRRLVLLAPSGFGVRLDGLFDMCCRVPLLGDLVWAIRGNGYLRVSASEAEAFPALPDLIEAQCNTRGFLRSVLSSGRHVLPLRQQDAHRNIAQAEIPVLAIWGRHDSIIPTTCAGELAFANREALQEVIEDADHGLPYTHSEQVLALVRPFLKA